MKHKLNRFDYSVISWMNCIWNTDLPANSKYLAAYLRKFMNSHHDVAWPSLSRIIHETGLGRTTVVKYLDILESEGWILRERGDSLKNTRYYCVLPKEIEEALASSICSSRDELGSSRDELGSSRDELGVVRETNPNKQSNKQSNKQKYTSAHLSMAEALADQMRSYHDTRQKVDLDKWADAIRKMLDIDGRTQEQIEYLWKWIYVDTINNQGFKWADNCRTPMKLRESKDGMQYFDIIASQIRQSRPTTKTVTDTIREAAEQAERVRAMMGAQQ